MKAENIKTRIFVPLTLAIAFIIAMFIFITYRHMHSHLDVDWNETIDKFQESFKTELDLDAQIMNAALDSITRDESLMQALKKRDRGALLKEAQPLFRHYLAEHDITHFYFHGPDRVNILRLHKPEQYGDRIDRFTLLEAEKIAQGKGEGYYAKGIELGPLGMFTNRVVSPWFDGGELVGYVEMGKELDRVFEKLRKDFGEGLYIFIHKEFLDRGKWEEGMKMLGRKPDWERYPSSVNVSGPIEQVSEETIQALVGKHLPHSVEKIEVKEKGRQYHFGKLPLVDAGGRDVGHMVVLREFTAEMSAVRSTVMLVSIVFLAVGAALFVIFYSIIGRIERDLEESRTNLERQRDELDRANADLSVLYDVASRVSRAIDLPTLLDDVLYAVLGLGAFGIERKGGIFLVEGDRMVLASQLGYSDALLALCKEKKVGDCLCGLAAKTGEMIVSKDSDRDDLHTIRYEGMARHGHVIVPLKAADRVEGVLCLYLPADLELEKSRLDMLSTLGSQIGAAIGNARMFEKVRESEERFRNVAEFAGDAIIGLRSPGVVYLWNRKAEEIFGYTADEIMGRNMHEMITPERYRERAMKGLMTFFQTGSGPLIDKTLEIEALRRNGEEFPAELSISAVSMGGEWRTIGIVRDITERRKMEEALKEANERLVEKTGTLERFNRLMVGRELEMIRLKAEVNELLDKSGQPKKYEAPEKAKG